MFRRLLPAAVMTAVALSGAMLAAGAAQAATATPCSGVITIDQSGFSPPSVPAGQLSTLTVVAQSCTDQTLQGQVYWFGTYTAPGGGLAQGCPVIDPVAQPYTIAPQASYTLTAQAGDTFPGCQATGLHITIDFTASTVTGLAAQSTADLVIGRQQQQPGVCQVSYTPGDWPGGFTANVTISDTGTAAVNGWTLTFTFPGDQKITNAWNATVTQAGASVSAANMPYNATIQPGGSQTFGFQGTWTASGAPPASFSVNGTACS